MFIVKLEVSLFKKGKDSQTILPRKNSQSIHLPQSAVNTDNDGLSSLRLGQLISNNNSYKKSVR